VEKKYELVQFVRSPMRIPSNATACYQSTETGISGLYKLIYQRDGQRLSVAPFQFFCDSSSIFARKHYPYLIYYVVCKNISENFQLFKQEHILSLNETQYVLTTP